MKAKTIDTEAYQRFAIEKLGFAFHDVNLLVTALTHRSYINEHQDEAAEHNERLEFLGDAVLELVTSDYLFRNFHQKEGIMTAWRSALVRTESIGAAGMELGYAPLIRMGKGEQRGTERAHAAIVADCFEAVLGATYLDQGYEAAKRIINDHILSKTDEMLAVGSWRDPKSRLQELAQHSAGCTPSYRLLAQDGPDHDKTFRVGVYIAGELRGQGVGHSQKEAQTIAAEAAIKTYQADQVNQAKQDIQVNQGDHTQPDDQANQGNQSKQSGRAN